MLSIEEGKIAFVDSKTLITYHERYNDPDFVHTLPHFSLPEERYPNKNYRTFEIIGDGMSQKINNGDWVFCELVEDFKNIKDRYVYVVVMDYETQCRRVLNRLKERGRLRLKCDNLKFGDVEITEDQIKEVWEVRSVKTFKLNNTNYEMEERMGKLEDMYYELKDMIDRGK